jgi:rubrerythrin
MPILTPTKADGSEARANDVVYVEPDQTVTDAELSTTMSMDGLNAPFLADLLSAYLTHERCGTHLYRSVAGRTNNPVLRARYEEFGEETLRHVQILEDLITTAGGNPAYVSPLARAVEAADAKSLEATFLAGGGLDPMAQEMAMLDAVFMAESIDHANWEALGRLAPMVPDGPIRAAMEAAVTRVESDEDEHLTWARDMRARMTLLQASGSLAAKAGAKAEELVASVKSWFTPGGPDAPAPVEAPPTATVRGARDRNVPSRPSPAAKSTTAKRSAATKPGTKKAVAAKKPASARKEATAKKPAAKKATATRSTAKKTTVKKTSAAKTAAKKATAKKTSAAKTAAKKSTAKRSTAKRSTAKRSVAKKSPATKSAAKKTAAKRSASRSTARR